MPKDRSAQRAALEQRRAALLAEMRKLDAQDRADERKAVHKQRYALGTDALDAGLETLDAAVRVRAFAALAALAQDAAEFQDWLTLWGPKQDDAEPPEPPEAHSVQSISEILWAREAGTR